MTLGHKNLVFFSFKRYELVGLAFASAALDQEIFQLGVFIFVVTWAFLRLKARFLQTNYLLLLIPLRLFFLFLFLELTNFLVPNENDLPDWMSRQNYERLLNIQIHFNEIVPWIILLLIGVKFKKIAPVSWMLSLGTLAFYFIGYYFIGWGDEFLYKITYFQILNPVSKLLSGALLYGCVLLLVRFPITASK